MTRDMANTFFLPQKGGSIINIIAQIHRGFPGMVQNGAMLIFESTVWHQEL